MAGSVRDRGGGRWELRADGPPDPLTGRRRQRSRVVRASGVREARRALAAFVTELASERPGADMTLSALVRAYIAAGDGRLAPSTLATYERNWRNWISPSLVGRTKVVELRVGDLEEFYRALLGHLAPSTIRQIHRLVGASLHHGKRLGWFDRVPEDVQPPKVRRRRYRLPTAAELALVLDQLAESNPTAEVACRLLVVTGARVGEAAGLRWRDVEWVTGTVTLHATKTDSARRVSVAPMLVELERHGERLRSQGLATEGRAPVFPRQKDPLRPIAAKTLSAQIVRAFNRAGCVGTRPHDLRHLAASVWLDRGLQTTAVSNLLGHSRTSTTLDVYAHLLRDHTDEAADLMADWLKHAQDAPQRQRP